jgi:2-polyprenyl-3-methyl-5-hydroxy-6-metoxy-1,4-benzoquinol methylase
MDTKGEELVDREAFKRHLDACTYDKKYQDIEYIDFIGYSSSYKTWDAIKDLIDWKDKRVADLGCFHGYFSFKIARLGGKVVAMDRAPEVLATTDILNEVYGNIIETRRWVGGELVSSDFDVALCLNVLHHFGDEEKALKNIKSKWAIFEVKYDQRFLISQYFMAIRKIQSHRVGRILVLGERYEST